jgi:aspartyl protease family protein
VKLLVVSVLLLASLAWSEPTNIVVRGLFDKAALFEIDGRRQLLRNGQRDTSGLRLISATPMQAVVDVAGRRQTLLLNKQVGAIYQQAPINSVVLRKNSRSEYRMTVSINGRGVEGVIDTGASSIAMSSLEAKRLGIAYEQGVPTVVATASGLSDAYAVSLAKVELGGIAVSHVSALVIEGNYPHVLLLGMSFLEHVNLQEHNNIMTLTARHN